MYVPNEKDALKKKRRVKEEEGEEEEKGELRFTEILPCTRCYNKTAAQLDSLLRYHCYHSAPQIGESLSNVP